MDLCCHLVESPLKQVVSYGHEEIFADKESSAWENQLIMKLFLLSIGQFATSVLFREYGNDSSDALINKFFIFGNESFFVAIILVLRV